MVGQLLLLVVEVYHHCFNFDKQVVVILNLNFLLAQFPLDSR